MELVVEGSGAVAVTPHHLATRAAMEIFGEGGNAVDAMVAANAVQGVVAPETCGVGGDLFALVWTPAASAPAALNSSGPAGSNADPEELRREGHRVVPAFHPLTVTVPGCVAGWEALVDRFGTLPLSRLLEPAIRLAEEGFAASTELSLAFAAREDELKGQPAGDEMYPGASPPSPGDTIRRPLLARTLRIIGSDGAAGFYGGEPGREISRAVDGRITVEDLVGFRPEWVEPLRLDVFGHTGWTIPPNSQGYLTLAASRIFEMTDPPADPQDPAWTHLLIEAYRSVAWERDDLVADPRRASVDTAHLLLEERLKERAELISPERVASWPAAGPAPGGTAYMCGLDADGIGVSLIQSNFAGIGSGLGAGSAGFLLHNRGAGFDLRPGHPNELAPGRRPLHTLSPSLWTRDGRLASLLGTRGGHQQPQLLIQLAARMFRLGIAPGDAQKAPRWTLDQISGDSAPLVEGDMPREVVAGLEQRGHRVSEVGRRMPGWGPVSVITIAADGTRRGAADPRVDTAAAAIS